MPVREPNPVRLTAPPARQSGFRRVGQPWSPPAAHEPGAPPVRARRREQVEDARALSSAKVSNAPVGEQAQGSQPAPQVEAHERNEPAPFDVQSAGVALLLFTGVVFGGWIWLG
jgi:hypothetical protein